MKGAASESGVAFGSSAELAASAASAVSGSSHRWPILGETAKHRLLGCAINCCFNPESAHNHPPAFQQDLRNHEVSFSDFLLLLNYDELQD